ncbi:MAG: type II/IV secretion system protein [Candidatus Omnitrophica bacterium]|nr:type II/IV secretion system protein [Candidatus Omnitrophota bacterium]
MSTVMAPLRAEVVAARLRDLGIATPQQLDQAKQELANTQERFSVILARAGLLRDADVGRRLAIQLGAVPRRLEERPVPVESAATIPATLWSSHRLIPLRQLDGTLLVATDDPLSVFALEFFARRCGCPLEAILVSELEFASLLDTSTTASGEESSRTPAAPTPATPVATRAPTEAALPRPATASQAPSTSGAIAGQAAGGTAPAPVPARRSPPTMPTASPATGKMSTADRGAASTSAEDAPIIQLVDSMLAEAVRMRASDVHLEAGMTQVRVRYRVDGVLRDVNNPPKALHGPIISRIKIMAGLNIAERRLPQDGRLQLSVEGRPLDVRISTLPATHGESIVMRLLDRSQPIRGLAEMGMAPQDQRAWEELIRRPHGMVLVTGPTGSGKTTTLYGAMVLLNQPDRKLITVEDPVEYQLTGINQVLVKPSIGLTFAAGLRSMLRQAPDVIMVGEIRDQETAQIAIQAALTGHLVLSTLHTNDAPSAITRLIDMGIAPFLIASTVQGVLAQRLVRRICPACRITDNATPEERAFLGTPGVLQIIRNNGCDQCRGTGFFGRVGIYELLVMSEGLRQLVVTKPTASAIRTQALKEGMHDMREDGVEKIREGMTTMTEVLRVVSEGEA